jgi:hypothetical protein
MFLNPFMDADEADAELTVRLQIGSVRKTDIVTMSLFASTFPALPVLMKLVKRIR